MNGCFRRNALLANAALILLCYVWRVFVDPCPRCKLLRRQAHGNCIPELVLSLPLSLPKSKTYRCIRPKQELNKVDWNIKRCSLWQRRGSNYGAR